MPIFEYKCDMCETVKDKLVSRAEADEGVTFPCECDEAGTLSRTEAPSAAALRFRGNWFSTTRGY